MGSFLSNILMLVLMLLVYRSLDWAFDNFYQLIFLTFYQHYKTVQNFALGSVLLLPFI